jgi:hypothetical protein
LSQGLSLNQILAGLNLADLNNLTSGLTNLLNGVLDNLLGAVLQDIGAGSGPGECSILDLTLGPVTLNLLGLVVDLDNCGNGPVTVIVSAHHGGLLGNLLCNLTRHGQFPLGSLLGDILAGLLATGPL